MSGTVKCRVPPLLANRSVAGTVRSQFPQFWREKWQSKNEPFFISFFRLDDMPVRLATFALKPIVTANAVSLFKRFREKFDLVSAAAAGFAARTVCSGG